MFESKNVILFLQLDLVAERFEAKPTPVPQKEQVRTVRENDPPAGFVVRGAPWESGPPNTDSTTDFPSFGIADGGSRAPSVVSWGPRR